MLTVMSDFGFERASVVRVIGKLLAPDWALTYVTAVFAGTAVGYIPRPISFWVGSSVGRAAAF